MRIACLQFAPQVGDVDNNLNRADSVLNRANPKNIDLLVLPELAFSGYNFRSLQHISPYLEPTTSGITSLWARTTALKYNCHVIAGYPEKVDVSPKWPASPEYYNSAITVNRDGETIANYRKSFLYYTDETWALEGPDGFYDGAIEGLGNVAMGICMDLNPYKFEAPWNACEFANHVLHREANLVVLSMAWLTRENARSYSRVPKEPDMETLSYWLSRLEPLIRNEDEGEIICVFANRCGVEEEAVYAGTSAVLGIQSGEVKVYGILGRGEKELLVVDTSKRAQMQLISEPRAPTTKAPSRSPRHSPVDTRSSASSSSTIDSTMSNSSALSIDTGRTSADPPPIEACSFSPISPVDHPFKQTFFPAPPPPPPEPLARPGSKVGKERQPTPIPQPQELQSILSRDRYPTPAPHSRPPSPKSRNASRSRGPTLADSPPRGEFRPEDIRLSRAHLSEWLDSPLVDEFEQDDIQIDDEPISRTQSTNIWTESPLLGGLQPADIRPDSRAQFSNNWVDEPLVDDHQDEAIPALEDKRLSRAQFSDNRITHSVSVDAVEHIPCIEDESEPEVDTMVNRPSRAASENSSQYESSFTKNSLGPRSRHISPRPRSTQW